MNDTQTAPGVEPNLPGSAVVSDVVNEVRSSADKLKSQYQTGTKKRPVGRPRKTAATVPLEKDTATPEVKPGADAGFKLDKEIVQRTVKAVVGSADNAVKRRVYVTGLAVGADKELAIQLAASASISTEEQTLIGELTGIIFEKRGWLTGMAPEILLGTILVAYTTRVTIVMLRLNELNKQNINVRVTKSSTDKSPDHG